MTLNSHDGRGSGRLPPGLDRRGFLRLSAGGTAAIVLASALPAGCAREYPQASADGADLLALSAKEYATARAAAEAMLAGVPVEPAAVARSIDYELAMVGDPIRGDMKTVLTLLEHTTLMEGHFRRFTALSAADRLATLKGWGQSRFKLRRGAYGAIKAFVHFTAYSNPATWPLTGFDGPWPGRVAIAAYPIDFGPIT